jgi:hypothetical protein
MSKITNEVLESFLVCRLKAHLKLIGECGTKSDFDSFWDERRTELRRIGNETIIESHQGRAIARDVSITEAELRRGADLILGAVVEDDVICLRIDGLKRVAGRSRIGDFH